MVAEAVRHSVALGLRVRLALLERLSDTVGQLVGVGEEVRHRVARGVLLLEASGVLLREAVVEAVPAARDALAEESGAEALGLPDWLTDALSRALAEGERVGSRGVALAGRVGSAV